MSAELGLQLFITNELRDPGGGTSPLKACDSIPAEYFTELKEARIRVAGTVLGTLLSANRR